MPQRFHIEDDELIQYALGTLKVAQLTTLTAHVSLCNECRTRLGAIQVELAAYATSLPEEGELPEGARQRFLSQLSGPPAQESRLEQARAQGRTGAFAAALKGWLLSPVVPWVLCGALGIAVLILTNNDLANIRSNRHMIADARRLENDSAAYQELMEFLNGGHTQQVTLHQSEIPNFAPVGHVTYLATTGRLLFTAANMPQLPPGKAYQLWLLPASGEAAIPAGTFVPDLAGNGAIIFPKLGSQMTAKGFGITAEDAKGANRPTMPWVLNGQ